MARVCTAVATNSNVLLNASYFGIFSICIKSKYSLNYYLKEKIVFPLKIDNNILYQLKKKLNNIKKNMVKKIKKICFDIDGVICKTVKNNYKKSRPIKKNIKLINFLFDNNFKIIVYTGRYMGRNKDKISKAKKEGYHFTKYQLKKWNLKYHRLIFGKPSFDLFIDDKSGTPT